MEQWYKTRCGAFAIHVSAKLAAKSLKDFAFVRLSRVLPLSLSCIFPKFRIRHKSKTHDLGSTILDELAEFLPYLSQRITIPYGYDYSQEYGRGG